MESISAAELKRQIAASRPPIVIDVRRNPVYLGSREMIRGSLRRDPDQVESWKNTLPGASSVIVYCVHGHEVSQRSAAALAQAGIRAAFLEGGLEEGWKA